ncbi:MAG: protein phosphatase 2C domain-containing protein [Proteobacteria bacterium]|nr:protein phosphatase 2C domain-containing protein [Pseudomonadota bacterium]
MRIRQSVAATHPGRRREINEDRVLRLPDERIFAVADGMGGPGAGDVAADLVLDAVKDARSGLAAALAAVELDRSAQARVAVTDAMTRIFGDANHRVRDAANRSGRSQMGSALVLLTFVRNFAYIAHVGHGRAYLYRGGRLTQLTEDHSVAELRYRRGRMTREEYEQSPDRHVLYQTLGSGADVDVDVAEVRLADGDQLLLCSDGLSRVLSEDELLGAFAAAKLPSTLRTLIGTANQKGGPDNVSAIVLAVETDAEDDSLEVLTSGLGDSALFRDLNGPERLCIAPYLEEHTAQKGEVLLEDGAFADRAFIVLDGELTWTRGRRVLACFGKGEAAGVVHLAREVKHLGELSASKDSRVVVLNRDRFQELLRQKPDIGARVAIALLDEVGGHMRDMADRLQAIERVARGE